MKLEDIKNPYIKEQIEKQISKRKKKHKYNAKPTEYKGETYRSKKEASFARELDMLKKCKDKKFRVKNWEREVRYDIFIGEKYIAHYKLDFKVEYENGKTKYFDVKGYKKGCAYSMFRLKKKLVEAIYRIEILEI